MQDNNARAPMTIRQQQRCLGLITVQVNYPEVPVVVVLHVAASKQLLPLTLYLCTIREEIGLSAGNFLAAVAPPLWRKCIGNSEEETVTPQAVADSLAPRLTDV